MDKLKKSRSILRAYFTKSINNLNELLSNEVLDYVKIESNYKILEKKAVELQEADKKVFDLLLDEDGTEEDLITENEKANEYLSVFTLLEVRISKLLQHNDTYSTSNVQSFNDGSVLSKRKFKLPQIELKKFDGDLKNWLPFWSQFSKINDDCDIVPEDKFQYLLQAIVPATRAYDLVESFPPTGPNYSKVIEGLKARFGKEDLLIEVYVRELLKLVLQNALGNKNQITLQLLYDKLESHLRALETLGVTTDKCASILYPLVESCMPEELLRAWQRSTCRTGDDPQDRLNNLMKFMLSEVEGEQRIGLAMSGFGVSSTSKDKGRKQYAQQPKVDIPTAASLISSSKFQKPNLFCIFCEKGHKSSECFLAQKMSLEDKTKTVKDKRCCFCCLKPGHNAKFCKFSLKCTLCNKKHFPIMCPNYPSKAKSDDSQKIETEGMTVLDQDSVLTNKSSKKSPKVFMQTLVAKLRSPSGRLEPVRVLFDTGSQRSYILSNLVKKMGYEPLGEERIIHSLFGNVKSAEQSHKQYRVLLSNKDNTYKCNFVVLDQTVICGDISCITPGPWLDELSKKNIQVTDVAEDHMPIGVLIGADVAGKLFTGQREMLKSGLVAMETLLGWTLIGKVPGEEHHTCISSVVTSMFIKDASISQLWNLDVLGIEDPKMKITRQEMEQEALIHFKKTVQVKDDGRYEVEMPWLDDHPPLPSNYEIAKKRLFYTVKKLKAGNVYEDYNQVFKQWEEEGIVEEIETFTDTSLGHYLPHRAVIKPNSTTPVRPVFDASAKGKNQPSLNDCLERGANLIELIPSILLRFRLNKIGVVSDIRKAFLQISLQERDRDFLKFLWLDDSDQIKVYRHTRVVFGVSCSPFLLCAVIDLHLQKCLDGVNQKENNFHQWVVLKLMKSFYVDNCIASVSMPSELNNFIQEATDIFHMGKFDLRGWVHSNPTKQCEPISVLGLIWCPLLDTLSLNPEILNSFEGNKVTKRTILSVTHSLFDPIGLTSAVSLVPKLILQEMWLLKLGWDDEVPIDVRDRFLKWFMELSLLKDLKVSRWFSGNSDDVTGWSLHTFCDASSKAYAAAVFIRIETETNIKVHLVQAKSRVAPKKGMTIPRLELLSALIGARLTQNILAALSPISIPSFFWSDSTTVISWLQRPCQWSVFVRNRVEEIQKITSGAVWRHIPGCSNPADVLSRGCMAKKFLQSKWWEGPEWMRTQVENWPHVQIECNETEINEEKLKGVSSMLVTHERTANFDWYYKYFSKFNQIVRLIGWINRFIVNGHHRGPKRKGELTASEFETARKSVIKLIQQESFTADSDKSFKSLKVIKDKEGVLRVETRIIERKDIYDFCYPVLLPGTHPVVKRLIYEEHLRNCHVGVQGLLSIIREKYWILKARKSIRAVVSQCTICRRFDAKVLDTVTGPLPSDRVCDAAVFEITGLDYAGPVYLKGGKKAWICLFTCAVYRAIHMELVSSLSTPDFLLALRRFIARRGRPYTIYSDNGTNFIGAENLFNKLDWETITTKTVRIKWRFNPPSAPWWGGWWERLIKIVKTVLKKVLGKSALNFDELNTTLCDCEAVVNSRPLTYVSEDSKDLGPLSPAHFLHDLRHEGTPDCDAIEMVNLNKRYQYRQKVSQALRKRFRIEYLGQLKEFSRKNKTSCLQLKTGDIVLIANENCKRIEWPMAVIEELVKGKDGEVRLLRLKTSSGFVLRPVKKVCLMETTSWEPNERKKRQIKIPRRTK